ncbi:MAG: hypothetical protein GVY31_13730 [Alphaproteobacteria bacterium]|jgi:hypothetical protein|nr:hypothetical protein [Alphaproteobacteria bacterium]
MRPFYEQYHYDRRPRKKVGDAYIKDFVTDFMNWHEENIADTRHQVPGKVHMTAHSQLDKGDFRKVVRRGIGGYFKATGEWPDFRSPKTFGAMNVLHALLMPMPKVQPADKLQVGRYIPKKLANRVQTARIVKKWAKGEEVSFDGIAPGSYYFKANHGSHFNLHVNIPCSDEEMAHIRSEARRWLSISYGLNSCQWWYRFIPPHVFLEEDLNDGLSDGPITDFRFHMINGRMALLQMDVGHQTEDRHNPIYDENLNYLPYDFLRENLREEPLPEGTDKAREVAIELGSKYQYCRVDLYQKGEEIYLGELTFLPNAGRRHVRAPELDELISSYWERQMPRFTRVN